MNAEHCKAYTLLQEQQIDDIHAHGYLLRHNKSGARVLLLDCLLYTSPSPRD